MDASEYRRIYASTKPRAILDITTTKEEFWIQLRRKDFVPSESLKAPSIILTHLHFREQEIAHDRENAIQSVNISR